MKFTNPSSAAELIADNMLLLRPEKEVKYRIRRKIKGVTDCSPLGARVVNLKEIFPNAMESDKVFVSADVLSENEFDAVVWVSGAEKIYIGGEEKRASDELVYFKMPRGKIRLDFLCDCAETLKFCVSIKYYPKMLAKDYLVHVRVLCPEGCGEGVAIGNIGAPAGDCFLPEKRKYGNYVDFSKLYNGESGRLACAVFYAADDTAARFCFDCPFELYVNGIKAQVSERAADIALKKGDKVICVCEKGEKWGFSFSGDFCLPFLENEEEFFPITIGSFDDLSDTEIFSVPNLKSTYVNSDGKECFFLHGFADEFITAELDGCFFGNWFYALMVGQYGLSDAYKLTKNKRYLDYFVKSMSVLSDYYRLQRWQKSVFGEAAFLQRGMNPSDLDSIGSIGMNLCELVRLTDNENAKKITDFLRLSMNKIPRFSDGTFNRSETMWADDTYMSCPFLLRYGILNDDRESIDEAVRQILGFKKYLFMEDKGLFSHIYFVDKKQKNRIAWGRGNGWVFITLSEMLEYEDKIGGDYSALKELFVRFAKAIISCQDKKSGLWHQVLDAPDSYEETSCSGMFIIGLCRGIRLGLLSSEAKKAVIKAYHGILEKKTDDSGNIYDVCRGSGCSMDAEYYKKLGTVKNDDHGTGIILSALYQINKIELGDITEV